MKHKIITITLQVVTIVALALTFVQAFAQSRACDQTYPQCDNVNIRSLVNQECVPGGSHWQVSLPKPYHFFACTYYYAPCGGAGPCNVYVMYSGMGRTIYYPDTNAYSYCMNSVSTYTITKTDCAGNPCDVPGGTDLPVGGYPPGNSEFVDWVPFPIQVPPAGTQ